MCYQTQMPFIYVILFLDIGQCCRPSRQVGVGKSEVTDRKQTEFQNYRMYLLDTHFVNVWRRYGITQCKCRSFFCWTKPNFNKYLSGHQARDFDGDFHLHYIFELKKTPKFNIFLSFKSAFFLVCLIPMSFSAMFFMAL